MSRVLVVLHDLDDHLNELGGPLVDAGLAIDTWCTWVDKRPQLPPSAYSAIVSMGAIAGVEDHHVHPWMAVESEYLADALSHGKPVLGVCFGSQLLAKVCGGRVFKAPTPEIGWTTVTATPEAAHDPLVAGLGTEYDGFQFHYDTFSLPDDVVVLGRTGDLIEAFRVGDNAWGLQFHIEANPGVALQWLGTYAGELAAAGVDPETWLRETAAKWRTYRDACWQVGARFADMVVARADEEVG